VLVFDLRLVIINRGSCWAPEGGAGINIFQRRVDRSAAEVLIFNLDIGKKGLFGQTFSSADSTKEEMRRES
jgi:hypothetical protein